MSQPTNETPSDTPICQANACFPACNDSSDTLHPQGTHIDIETARAIERAANAMADAIRRDDQVLMAESLAAFASLKGAKG